MALALAESANKALRQGASPPYRPRQRGTSPETDIRIKRSLSADAGALLSSDPNQITPPYDPCLCGRLRVMTTMMMMMMMMMRLELLLKSLQTNHMVQRQGHHLDEALALSLLIAQSLILGHPILSCQLPVPLKTMSEHQAPFTRMKNQPLQHSLQNPAHPLPVKPSLLKENPQLMGDRFLLHSFSRRNPAARPSLQPNHTLSFCILNQRALHWPRYEPFSPLALKCHPSRLILLPWGLHSLRLTGMIICVAPWMPVAFDA